MARKKKAVSVAETAADAYSHSQKAVQRPDVGVQEEFQARKPPKTYRYDSSLAAPVIIYCGTHSIACG